MNSFTTEYGHEIAFVPGYYERNRFYADFARERWTNRRPYENEPPPTFISHHMVAKDWVLFSSLVTFLGRRGLTRRWRAGIDLGGGEGSVIRMFKAAGLVERAINVDIVDFSKVADDEFFRVFLRAIATPGWDKDPKHKVTEAINWAKIHLDLFPLSEPLTGLVTSFPSDPIAENIVASVYDVEGQYDLVIANALLEFVDLDITLPKIRDILEPGGIFVGSLNCAWCPIVPSGLLGDFPYMFQRLTFSDAQRYLEQYRPEQLFNLENRYNWFHSGKYRPTLSQWFDIFLSRGLKVIGFERVSSIRSQRYKDTPAVLFKQPWFDHREVLRDARHINPGVTEDDIATTTIKVAAIKVA